MNLISMYSAQKHVNESIQQHNVSGMHPYSEQQILKLLLTIMKQRTFIATIISPTLSPRNRILTPSETICFSLTQQSKNINYEYMFQVELNLQTNLWKITATIVKNGRMINVCKQGLVQMLCTYSLNVNAYMTNYTLRIHPFTGIVKFSYITHYSQKLINDIFRLPVDFCERVTQHVREMTNRLDERLLGKILHVTNQISITTILPTKLSAKLPDETPQYINKLRSKNPLFQSYNLSSVYKKYRLLKQVRKFIINSNIKYSFLSKDTQKHKIRFLPDIQHKKQFEKQHRVVRHNIKVINFSKDVKRVLALYTNLDSLLEENSIYGTNKNFDVSQIEPTDEEVKQILQILRIDNFIGNGRILTPITLHSKQDQTTIGFGGFAQISRVLVSISSRQQIENPESKTNQAKKIIKQILVRKSAVRQRLFWQKSVIHQIGVGSCVFINKYYEPKLDTQAIGIDKAYLDSSIFMDYCQDKSLNNYINKLSSIMSIKIKIFLLYQVTVGLRYLRDSGIVHLDMKPENLLVKMASMSSNNLAIIKIIDFGEAYGEYLISKRDFRRGHTCPYASPELVRHSEKKYTQKSDVFSLGVMILIIVFELNTIQMKRVTSANLFQSNQKYIKFYSICVQKCKYLGYEPQMLSLLNLAYKCINPIPTSRPYLDWISVVLRSLLSLFECLEV